MVIYNVFCNFQNEKLQAKIQSQNEEIENLQNSLEFNKLQGDYNPDSTKVSICLKKQKKHYLQFQLNFWSYFLFENLQIHYNFLHLLI